MKEKEGKHKEKAKQKEKGKEKADKVIKVIIIILPVRRRSSVGEVAHKCSVRLLWNRHSAHSGVGIAVKCSFVQRR